MIRKGPVNIFLSVMMMITMIPLCSFAAVFPFHDVEENAWYYNDVKNAYETGLIHGMTENTFEPASDLTYAQAVKLAACMNQKYTTGSVTIQNGSSVWYDSYVAYAKENHIINKDYDWNSCATRAGYAEIFAGALPDDSLKEINRITDGYIADVGITHPQSAAIYKLYRAGILNGTDALGTFRPDSNIKRSEVSAILTRMMNESERREITLGPDTDEQELNILLNRSDLDYLRNISGTIYVTGHKSPDADTVGSSISYAKLLQKLGFDAVPVVLGNINRETQFILTSAGEETPEMLNDASGKNVILVDHSEYAQSADGLKDAVVLSIIDHHGPGSVSTG